MDRYPFQYHKNYYAFVESRDPNITFSQQNSSDELKRHLMSVTNINAEITLSLIEQTYFHEIHEEFGRCRPDREQDREKRIKLIKKYLIDKPQIAMSHLWCDIKDGYGSYFRQLFGPGKWRLITLTEEITDGFPLVTMKDESFDDSSMLYLYLSKIEPVDRGILNRLLEIFSLNHIQEAEMDAPLDPGYSMTPLTPLKPLLGGGQEIDLIGVEYDEFGLIPSQIRPYRASNPFIENFAIEPSWVFPNKRNENYYKIYHPYHAHKASEEDDEDNLSAPA